MECILYKGNAFCIEWYHDTKGNSQALKFYRALNQKQKIQFLKLVKLMGDIGKIHNKEKFRNEGNKVFAFKPMPNRFLCFFVEGKKIVVTNAFVKKQNSLPVNEKIRALKYREDYIERVKEGAYYNE
ncbi:MAG: hypothetical protein COA71_03765 [SAR86 cluster bacterium]|uniref:Type II toxin-antitoxin system RelE/ParE family toxin n=1 Tax=SAR86 cluster bacterium TaxID=2030880 RepID=A0A2A5CGK5_9GAMM|nr:type II toxin-antitoxin system RelE/ParE family toxin [Gammaproteobacteria bacterium AH-315-E17]PCJ42635.1 MAG: hypothetical protein COA71_03765 [SAR86 cluster bacterium]